MRTLNFGETVFRAGEAGPAWRVRRGAVRLDMVDAMGQRRFASLAIGGDILGCETLLLGTYTFTASALTQCELISWPEAAGTLAPAESMLASLAQAHRRAADLLTLRGGQAVERVLGLIRLLAERSGRLILPTRQDIAEITDLRIETISRVIKDLERSGVLRTFRIDGVHATRSYIINQSG